VSVSKEEELKENPKIPKKIPKKAGKNLFYK
jgi:hypothetical protein